MYCSICGFDCKDATKCPRCGGDTLDAHEERHPERYVIVDDSCLDDDELETDDSHQQNKPTFNFSKPLCLVFSLILIATLFFPWIQINGRFELTGELDLTVDNSFNAFTINDAYADVADQLLKLLPIFGVDMSPYENTINTIRSVVFAYTSCAIIMMFCFLMFGIIGLFSKGKARYFFAMLGSWIGIVLTTLTIASVLACNSIAKSLVVDSGLDVHISIATTIYPAATFVVLVLFLTAGLRALRYLNGISRMNRGDYDTASAEFKILRKYGHAKRMYKKCMLKSRQRANAINLSEKLAGKHPHVDDPA